jgi:hypothetical protein
MQQNHYSINIAKRDGVTYLNEPRYVHHCKIEKACVDLPSREALQAFVDDIRKAFAAIGEFKISVTEWQYSGKNVIV